MATTTKPKVRKVKSFYDYMFGKRVKDPGMAKLWRDVAPYVSEYAGGIVKAEPSKRAELVEALRFVGSFFVANPHRFVQGTYNNRVNDTWKVCSVGLLRDVVGQFAPEGKEPPQRPHEQDVFNSLFVGINDTRGMTPVRLKKIYNAIADHIEAIPYGDGKIGTFEAAVKRDFERRAVKAEFNKKRAAKLAKASAKAQKVSK